ncbi:PAS domain S-box protein [Baekduia soli]|uniref:histidine kinase n=1 Tax=Baekduia soli TaxID=496014 RepID=A0A5B8U515_9ACTN|nr:PAS domain S-box protein [Baekduia soli]
MSMQDVQGATGRPPRGAGVATIRGNELEGPTQPDTFWDLASDLFAVAGADDLLTALNPSWERVLGWSRVELMSRPLTEFLHPDDVAATAARMARIRAAGDRIDGLENRWRCRDGSHRLLSWTGHTDGRVWSVVGRDITDQQQERLLLREAHRVAGLTGWEWRLDSDDIVLAGPAGALLGVPPAATPRYADLLAAMHPDDRRRVGDAMAAVRAGRADRLSLEHRMIDGRGRVLWLETHGRLVRDGAGAPLLIRGTTQDVSRRGPSGRSCASRATSGRRRWTRWPPTWPSSTRPARSWPSTPRGGASAPRAGRGPGPTASARTTCEPATRGRPIRTPCARPPGCARCSRGPSSTSPWSTRSTTAPSGAGSTSAPRGSRARGPCASSCPTPRSPSASPWRPRRGPGPRCWTRSTSP